jgi:hypothetical protein
MISSINLGLIHTKSLFNISKLNDVQHILFIIGLKLSKYMYITKVVINNSITLCLDNTLLFKKLFSFLYVLFKKNILFINIFFSSMIYIKNKKIEISIPNKIKL